MCDAHLADIPFHAMYLQSCSSGTCPRVHRVSGPAVITPSRCVRRPSVSLPPWRLVASKQNEFLCISAQFTALSTKNAGVFFNCLCKIALLCFSKRAHAGIIITIYLTSSCQSATVTLLLSLSPFVSVTLSLTLHGGVNQHPSGSASTRAHYFRGNTVPEMRTNRLRQIKVGFEKNVACQRPRPMPAASLGFYRFSNHYTIIYVP